MKSALILSLATFCAPLAAQQAAAVKIPSPRPSVVDPDRKTETWVAPVKSPATPGSTTAAARPVDGTDDLAASKRARPAAKPTVRRAPADQVAFDAPGDGRIWARGRTYKASFDGQGATYIPFLGSAAPRNYPVHFTLQGVRVGGQDVAFKADGEVARTDRRVTIARGSVTEVYDLMPDGVEQSFVLGALPAAGDLVVRVGVTTELAPIQSADGLRFGNELGQVGYGEAIVLDANGRRAGATTRFDDGTIVLTVPAAFLADATLPVTIDPVVTTFGVTWTTIPEHSADIAYDQVTNRYMVVWEETFSATDHDLTSVFEDENGVMVPGSYAFMDLSSELWSHARVANMHANDTFLMVAERGLAPGRQIWSRTRNAHSFSVGTPVEVSANGGNGDKLNPDVGGDGNPAGSYFTVVWERTYNATDSDIFAQQVEPSGALHNGLIAVDNTSGSHDTHPSISRSNGSSPWMSQYWTVVWQRTFSPSDEDIQFARIAWDGTVTTPSSALDTSSSNDTNPVVSSPTDEQNGVRSWLAVYERQMGAGNRDLMGTLGRNATLVSGGINLTTLASGYPDRDQAMPHVDSDGCRFTVVYGELYPMGLEDWDIHAATFHVLYGSALGVTDHSAFGFEVNTAIRPRITSTRSGGGAVVRNAVVWDERVSVSPLDTNVRGGLYDGRTLFGGFAQVYTGCDGLGITPSGLCAIGGAVDFQMTGIGAGNLPVMMLGFPTGPITVCGACRLGIDLGSVTLVPASSLHLPIPREGAFVGGVLAVQGFTLGVGACVGSQVSLSDTVRFAIQ